LKTNKKSYLGRVAPGLFHVAYVANNSYVFSMAAAERRLLHATCARHV
jgi:hypothetical protein